MKMRSMWFPVLLRRLTLGVAVSAGLVGGCQDPQYKNVRATRDQRIQELLKEYGGREKVRRANIDEVMTRVETEELERVEAMDATLLLIKESHQRDQREWLEQAPRRHEMLRSSLAGKPEQIPGSWRKIGY